MESLKDKWIVVTRPEHQSENLRRKIEAVGGKVILFPLLEIQEVEDISFLKNQILQLQGYDLAIFVSSNAVEKTFQMVSKTVFDKLEVAAIGRKTASSLESHNISVDYHPSGASSSETLLSHPKLQGSLKGRRIAILRGVGGRELLKKSLQERGAIVDYFEVYRRVSPQKNIDTLAKYANRNKLDIILLSSGESLDNLFLFLSDNSWLNEITLLLGSKRILKIAEQITSHTGKKLMVEEPSDEAFYRSLIKWNGHS